jgi:hypothetical protein
VDALARLRYFISRKRLPNLFQCSPSAHFSCCRGRLTAHSAATWLRACYRTRTTLLQPRNRHCKRNRDTRDTTAFSGLWVCAPADATTNTAFRPDVLQCTTPCSIRKAEPKASLGTECDAQKSIPGSAPPLPVTVTIARTIVGLSANPLCVFNQTQRIAQSATSKLSVMG